MRFVWLWCSSLGRLANWLWLLWWLQSAIPLNTVLSALRFLLFTIYIISLLVSRLWSALRGNKGSFINWWCFPWIRLLSTLYNRRSQLLIVFSLLLLLLLFISNEEPNNAIWWVWELNFWPQIIWLLINWITPVFHALLSKFWYVSFVSHKFQQVRQLQCKLLWYLSINYDSFTNRTEITNLTKSSLCDLIWIEQFNNQFGRKFPYSYTHNWPSISLPD